jgi:tetratricopeptide (TPR) repeat protein
LTERDWREQVQTLLGRASRLDPGEAKVMALEEAARLADAHGDVPLAFEVRDALIDAATFGGFPDKALVAFAWCRGQQQKDPDRLPLESLLWKQKWVVGRLDEFPHISRKQIEGALADVEQCFAKAGAGQRAVMKLRYQAARDMGDTAAADAFWAKWVESPRDHLTDCRACELDDELDHHIDRGEYAVVLEKARPLLEGRNGCAEVPHLTLGSVLYPLFKLGRLEQARDNHLRGYALVQRNREFLATVGEHLEFLCLTGNVARGLVLFERHVGWALEHASHRDRFTFYTAALSLMERALAEQRERVELSLPRGFTLYSPEGTYETRTLRGWLAAQAEGIGAKFDARNGTNRFHQLLTRARRLGDEAVSYPIDAPLPS